jgi:hypothetical protein
MNSNQKPISIAKGIYLKCSKRKSIFTFCPAISGKVLPMAVATPQDLSIHLSVHPWRDSSWINTLKDFRGKMHVDKKVHLKIEPLQSDMRNSLRSDYSLCPVVHLG